MARWFGLTEMHPRFLTQPQADAIYAEGMLFVNTHLELTRISCRPFQVGGVVSLTGVSHVSLGHIFPFRQSELTWALKPKLHTFEHQLIGIRRTSCLDQLVCFPSYFMHPKHCRDRKYCGHFTTKDKIPNTTIVILTRTR